MRADSTSARNIDPLTNEGREENRNPDCPCKRAKCENHGNCRAYKNKHHNAGRDTPTTCERLNRKKSRSKWKDKG